MNRTPTLHSGVTGYSVRVLKAKTKSFVHVSASSKRIFHKISDPAHAQLFSAEAALDAFDDVKL